MAGTLEYLKIEQKIRICYMKLNKPNRLQYVI